MRANVNGIGGPSGWGLAGLALGHMGRRIVNGMVESRLGVEDVDVTGAAGMVGHAMGQVLDEAWARSPDDAFLSVWARRFAWGAGIAAGTALTAAGAVWLVRRWWRGRRGER